MQGISRVLKPDRKLFVAEDLVDGEEERKMMEMTDRKLNLAFANDNPHFYKNIEEWKKYRQ